MLVTLLFLALLSFGAGFATHKHITLKRLHNRPEPPLLDTPEDVLSYLEACSYDEFHPEMAELFGEFRSFVNQKQLPEGTPVALQKHVETVRPDWYHNPDVNPSCREHWEVFLADLLREEEVDARVGVVRHWMTGLENNFTYKEMEMILDHFDDAEARAEVRKIFAAKNVKKEVKAKKKVKNG
jgi:hypothetical protein